MRAKKPADLSSYKAFYASSEDKVKEILCLPPSWRKSLDDVMSKTGNSGAGLMREGIREIYDLWKKGEYVTGVHSKTSGKSKGYQFNILKSDEEKLMELANGDFSGNKSAAAREVINYLVEKYLDRSKVGAG